MAWHCLPRVRSAIITKLSYYYKALRVCFASIASGLAPKNKANDLGLAKQCKKRCQ